MTHLPALFLAAMLALAPGHAAAHAVVTGSSLKDAEAWPLGFWVSMFGNAEILQHRLATLLAFTLRLREIKTDYLIQSTHFAMGLLAVIMAIGRWLELRLGEAGDVVPSRGAGLVAVCAMLAIGAALMFYKEPLY